MLITKIKHRSDNDSWMSVETSLILYFKESEKNFNGASVFYFCYQINGPIEYIELNAASNRKSCSQRL